MKKFDVSLYQFKNKPIKGWYNQEDIPLTWIFSGVIEADDKQLAAARAWINHEGKHRKEKLDDLGASDVVKNYMTDEKEVMRQLTNISFGMGWGYLLDNEVESWLICVKTINANMLKLIK